LTRHVYFDTLHCSPHANSPLASACLHLSVVANAIRTNLLSCPCASVDLCMIRTSFISSPTLGPQLFTKGLLRCRNIFLRGDSHAAADNAGLVLIQFHDKGHAF
jgi:hypothetical protein